MILLDGVADNGDSEVVQVSSLIQSPGDEVVFALYAGASGFDSGTVQLYAGPTSTKSEMAPLEPTALSAAGVVRHKLPSSWYLYAGVTSVAAAGADITLVAEGV